MTTVEQSQNKIRITSALAIPLSELEFRFSRSSGPGGQRVNRRETRVELLFDVQHSPSLNDTQRARLLTHLASHIDQEGVLRIVATTHRSQLRNREEALERFVQLLRRGLRAPRRRLPTKPSPQSIQQRLEQKRRRAEIKAQRRRIQLATSE
ncbi:MAG: aminoacyl-tRNA hydrolase [Chloroflexi bacterium]|nr:aminoacyl-tRNA hydrolase [Chloroflexota bacterium]